jgi:uncharacterized protein (DUF1684 family)
MGIIDSIKKAIAGDEQADHAEHIHHDPQPVSDSFYIDTLEFDRAEKDRFFRSSPHSPIADRVNFAGLAYYPPDPAYRYELALDRADQPDPLTFQTSTGDERTYHRIGTVDFVVDGEAATLALYQADHHDELFLPFRDATSGSETYGAGRYLEPELLSDGRVLLDFNLAYNPFCAYSDAYSCPLPPFENHLTIPIRAGEKAFDK